MQNQAIKIHTKEQFEKMRKAGKLAAMVLNYIEPYIKEGVSTIELNDLCHEYMIKHNSIPAPLEAGFPKSICTSVNHVVCHGIPDNHPLIQGDILNIDVSLKLDGWHGDTSRMFSVGTPSVKAKKLMKAAYDAMWAGIKAVKPGNTLGDVGYAIENSAKQNNFTVVKEYCGHGIGTLLHDFPPVTNYGKPKEGIELQEGMFFTIEPMLNAGKADTILSKHDKWTVTSRDKSLSAQYEHTLAVTKDAFEIFTLIE